MSGNCSLARGKRAQFRHRRALAFDRYHRTLDRFPQQFRRMDVPFADGCDFHVHVVALPASENAFLLLQIAERSDVCD